MIRGVRIIEEVKEIMRETKRRGLTERGGEMKYRKERKRKGEVWKMRRGEK